LLAAGCVFWELMTPARRQIKMFVYERQRKVAGGGASKKLGINDEPMWHLHDGLGATVLCPIN